MTAAVEANTYHYCEEYDEHDEFDCHFTRSFLSGGHEKTPSVIKLQRAGKSYPRYHLSLLFFHKNSLVGYGANTRYPSAVTGVPDAVYLRHCRFQRTAHEMYSIKTFLLSCTHRQLSGGKTLIYLFSVIAFVVDIVAL